MVCQSSFGSRLAAQGFCAEDFCDASLAGIARLDEQEQAQYVRSLHAYLSSGLNLRHAAETLSVHRNTLAYRMRRIEERFALDLSDMNTCFELLFALWLREGVGGETRPEADAPFDGGAARAALWRFAERADGGSAPSGGRFALAVAAVGVGGLSDPAFVEEQLASGRITCAAMSRQLLADPEWPNKVAADQCKEIHRCVRCNKKCLGGLQLHQGTHCIYEKG